MKKILSYFLIIPVYLCAALLMPQISFAESAANDGAVQLKRKIAIARFTNETQSGTSFLLDDSGDRVGKQASDILSARLTDTGKFLMFSV